ncbi:MAG: RIP metalloprotease RseP [Synergistaceae bacterium]|jgi:regulator of sigma E protease|nr:RIP metalloprotease RseP [Synergistaceae bacterium]
MIAFLWSFVSFVVVIAICVLVHEYGHYITARLVGVQVHEFSLGMGPLLKQKVGHNGENRMLWSLRALPIGGSCRVAGMGEDEEGETVAAGRGFNEQPGWKRFLILLDGSLFNIILAFLLTAFLLAGHGAQDMSDTRIGTLIDGFPAKEAGLMEGDRIVKVNGAAVSDWRGMTARMREAADSVVLTVDRDGREFDLTVALRFDKESGSQMLGITPAIKRLAPADALGGALRYVWHATALTVRALVNFVFRQQEVEVTGPVGIAAMSGRAMSGGFWSFVLFLAVINLSLGILNLIPFPALDGGRIFFVLLEMVFRRRLPEKVENWIHTTGFVLLILIMLIVTWQDISRMFFSD